MVTASTEFVGLYEAARLLGINPDTAKKLLHSGKLSGRHIPGTPAKITRRSVDALIAKYTYGEAATN